MLLRVLTERILWGLCGSLFHLVSLPVPHFFSFLTFLVFYFDFPSPFTGDNVFARSCWTSGISFVCVLISPMKSRFSRSSVALSPVRVSLLRGSQLLQSCVSARRRLFSCSTTRHVLWPAARSTLDRVSSEDFLQHLITVFSSEWRSKLSLVLGARKHQGLRFCNSCRDR